MMLSTSHGCWHQCNGITWNQQCQWHHVMPMASQKKGHSALHFNCFNLSNAVVPLMKLLASFGTDASANGVKWPKSHVAFHFNYLDLSNVMLPFYAIGIMWCHQQSSGSTWPKKLHLIYDFLDLANGMIPLMTLLASCDTDTNINGITWPNCCTCCTLSLSPWSSEYNGADTSINSVKGLKKSSCHSFWFS